MTGAAGTAASLRREMRAYRRRLTRGAQTRAARRACAVLQRLGSYRRARRVAAYCAQDGELSARYILAHARRTGRACYLPVLRPGNRLAFAPVSAGGRLRRNRFGIPEPVVARAQRLPASALDLILVPLVAFDAAGNRLGMGGGFYDRTLAFLRARSFRAPPVVIGLAHSGQQVVKLNAQAWDIPLMGVITDRGFLRMRVR